MNARECAHHLRDLCGRYVFTLPTEGIADAVDEIEIALGITAHEIAGAEPSIALGEHVAQDFDLVVSRIGIALEPPARLRWVLENPADRLADLPGRGLLASAERIAYEGVALDIEPQDLGLKPRSQEPRDAADRTRLSFHIEQRDVTLGRGVKFKDQRNCKA